MEIQKEFNRSHYILFGFLIGFWHVGTITNSNIITIPISVLAICFLFYSCLFSSHRFGLSLLIFISLMDIPRKDDDYLNLALQFPYLNINILPIVFFFIFLTFLLRGGRVRREHLLVAASILLFYSFSTLNGLIIGKIFSGKVVIAELYTLVSYFLFFVVFYWRKEHLPSLSSIVNISSIKIFASLICFLIFEGVEIGNTVLFRNPAVPFIWVIGLVILSRGILTPIERVIASLAVFSFIILNFQKGYLLYTLLFLLILPVTSLIDPPKIAPKQLFISLFIIVFMPFLIFSVREAPKVKYEINSLSSVVSGVSPRAVEFLNITSNFREQPTALFIGTGAGSYFEEKVARFRPWQRNTSAFTEEELAVNRFHKPHDFVNWSLLKVGLGGLILILGSLGFYFVKNVKYHFILLPAFAFFLVGLMQGVSMAVSSALLLVCTTNWIRMERSKRAKIIDQ